MARLKANWRRRWPAAPRTCRLLLARTAGPRRLQAGLEPGPETSGPCAAAGARRAYRSGGGTGEHSIALGNGVPHTGSGLAVSLTEQLMRLIVGKLLSARRKCSGPVSGAPFVSVPVPGVITAQAHRRTLLRRHAALLVVSRLSVAAGRTAPARTTPAPDRGRRTPATRLRSPCPPSASPHRAGPAGTMQSAPRDSRPCRAPPQPRCSPLQQPADRGELGIGKVKATGRRPDDAAQPIRPPQPPEPPFGRPRQVGGRPGHRQPDQRRTDRSLDQPRKQWHEKKYPPAI